VTGPGGALRTTPLIELHRELGARLVEFAGWQMPVQYASILEEHHAVRRAAGLFDVSHMGEIEIRGGGALALVQRLTCNDAARLEPGAAQYSALTTAKGTFVDDILVYRRGRDAFLLVVNAANAGKAFAWIAGHAEGDVEVVDVSGRWAQLAVQGPSALSIIQPLTGVDLGAIRGYHFAEGAIGGVRAILSRTGYTGEDGFEIYLPPEAALDVARALLRAGQAAGLQPCGLGARDTLRLEAGMPLYGNDIDETTTVLEAGLARIVRFEKGEFLGRGALVRQKEIGAPRQLCGFEMVAAGIPRHGHAIRIDGREAGTVTSGTLGPWLKKSIGMGYVPAGLSRPGQQIQIVIREREAAAAIVPLPFYRRPR